MLTLRIMMDVWVWIFAPSRINAAGRRYPKQQQQQQPAIEVASKDL